MFRELNNIEEFMRFFTTFTPEKLRLLFLMRDWKPLCDIMDVTGLSRGGIMYHMDLLDKEGLVESRLVSWKTTYRKEYKAKPLILQVNFLGKPDPKTG